MERSHHSLAEYLKTIINADKSWDDCLELATFCYNTAQHEAYKFTPYELVFGKVAHLSSSEAFESKTLPTYQDYVVDLNTQINKIQEKAHEKLIDSKIRAEYYNHKKINPQNFRVGDNVWLLEGGRQYKLADQYQGPYTAIEIMNNRCNVTIRVKNNRTKIVHVNRLRISYVYPDD